MAVVRTFAVLVLCLAGAAPAVAQNWSFDARQIALGSVGGGNENLAAQLMADQKGYRSIVIPLGLIQVPRKPSLFNPTSDDFDIVKAIEYASSPLHFQIGRDSNEAFTGRSFVVDIANAGLSRDLNTYRGFVPSNQPAYEGLASPVWGGTLRVVGDEDGPFQGIYIGAGPYLAMRTQASIDQRIIDILGSATDVYFQNSAFQLSNDTTAQVAASFVGGYRGRFDIGTDGERDGVYAGFNYRYLRGFRLEDFDASVRLDTDGNGLLTVNPFLPSPLFVSRNQSTSGTGFAIDFGIGAIVKGVEASFGINGVNNRIDWKDVERRTYAMGNLFLGDDVIVQTPPVPVGDMRIELPVDYRAHGGYRNDFVYGMVEYGRGFQGTSLRAGLELGRGPVVVRGGGMYIREQWNPTVGVGFNLSRRAGIDVALYGTTGNAARERRQSIAVSIRIMDDDNRPQP